MVSACDSLGADGMKWSVYDKIHHLKKMPPCDFQCRILNLKRTALELIKTFQINFLPVLFSSPGQSPGRAIVRKSYCTTPGVGVGIGVGVSKMLEILH